eukprot:scaffold78514_cov21-Tisochrysis_lutea.AAC.2
MVKWHIASKSLNGPDLHLAAAAAVAAAVAGEGGCWRAAEWAWSEGRAGCKQHKRVYVTVWQTRFDRWQTHHLKKGFKGSLGAGGTPTTGVCCGLQPASKGSEGADAAACKQRRGGAHNTCTHESSRWHACMRVAAAARRVMQAASWMQVRECACKSCSYEHIVLMKSA